MLALKSVAQALAGLGLAISTVAATSAPARAQFPMPPPVQQPAPQYLCQMAAQTAQTGGPALYGVYGQQLLQVIFQQTSGTGVYTPLVQLGQVTNIVIGGVNQLPNGTFVSCRVFHVNGFSDWQIGFSPFTQRIENSTFMPYWTAAQPMPPQAVQPLPPGVPGATGGAAQPIQPQPQGRTPPPQPAPTQSEACRKFPNLC